MSYHLKLQALIKKKNPQLHEHLMSLTALEVEDVNNIFFDFLNESLLRGLSGLLNMETCQFVWDQCFIVGERNAFGAVHLVQCGLILKMVDGF